VGLRKTENYACKRKSRVQREVEGGRRDWAFKRHLAGHFGEGGGGEPWFSSCLETSNRGDGNLSGKRGRGDKRKEMKGQLVTLYRVVVHPGGKKGPYVTGWF